MTARDRSPHPTARRAAVRVPALAPTLYAGALVALVAGAAACNGPRVIHERPILVSGQRVDTPDGARLGAAAAGAQAATLAERDSIAALATATCEGALCTAVARGEVTLGMTEAQVMAATRTASDAWTVRRAGTAATMTPATLLAPPADVVSEVALVQLADGRVRSIGYREPQGLRVVERPEDQTPDGRARATADALIREGDQYVAAGDRVAALDRFDRALVLVPGDAMLQYRVATLLDLQLRPVEALMRYQRFLQTLELQRIEAVGNANAKLADAIARAQQRIIVLERQGR